MVSAFGVEHVERNLKRKMLAINPKKQIIALGGGGFSEEPDNPLLDLYVLRQANVARPKICFLPTASGDADSYVVKFYKAFTRYECCPSHLSLFTPHTANLEDFLLGHQIIYVGGGNTKSMLAIWKEWGIDVILKMAWQKGIILAGVSAGAICWFQEGATDSIPGTISSIRCLGFIKGSCCPHFDGSELRQKMLPELIRTKKLLNGYAVDDSAALHFTHEAPLRAVCSIKGKKISYLNSESVEYLAVEYLG